MDNLLWFLFIGLCIYTIIPTIIIRLFGLGAVKKGAVQRAIALTFDDGPDPEYTPQLLDLLKRYKARATFFLLGSMAEKYPELTRRIHDEGHLIGVHNYVHRSNAFMSPWKVRRQLDCAIRAIEKITGERPIHYRPPWGVFNVFDLLLFQRFRVVLWSIIVGDWRRRVGTRKIKRRLVSRSKDGSVIVLHDSGRTLGADADAPGYMLEALREFMDEYAAKGFDFLRIDEMTSGRRRTVPPERWPKRLLRRGFLQWERGFHRLYGVKPVDPQNELLYYRICRYHGQPIALKDGEWIRKGDRVAELHFNNAMVVRMMGEAGSEVQLAVNLIRSVGQLLPKLKENLLASPETEDVKGVYGITMIHRGAQKLGFSVLDLSRGLFFAATQIYLRLLLFILHPDGKRRLSIKRELLKPRILAMSASELSRLEPGALTAGHAPAP